MKLGIAIDWAAKKMTVPLEKILLAERLGFDSVWSAEAYGSDAITPLAYIAALTKRIRLATSVTQVSARTPAATAMAFNTLDQLAGEGRAVCGLGLSGPQVVEGWYGQPWDRPYHRMKDSVNIIKKIWQREQAVEYSGKAISLPFQSEFAAKHSSRFGKPLKSITHTNAHIPVLLGTGSELMVKLTAEIADGWIPFGFAPGDMAMYRPWLEHGFAKAGKINGFDGFEIYAPCVVALTDDVQAELDKQKEIAAFYVGGMGHEKINFHKDRMVRAGYREQAEKIQQLFLEGRRDEAAQVVPDEFIDNAALIGPIDRIVKKLSRWDSSGVTGLTLHGANPQLMKVVADYFQG